MKNGDEVEVVIEGLTPSGAGLVGMGDLALHVDGAAPGDTVRAYVESVSRHHPVAYARVREVISRGPAFVQPPCHHAAPVRGRCGGCALMHVEPRAALTWKRGYVAEQLQGIAEVQRAERGDASLEVRNRGSFLLWRSPAGEVRYGSRQRRSASLARMDGCPMLQPPLVGVAERVVEALVEHGAPIAPEPGGAHGLSLRADPSGGCLVEIITLAGAGDWVRGVAEYVGLAPAVVGVLHSTHDGTSNAVRQSAPEVVAGRGELEFNFLGVAVSLASDAFFQLNYAVASKMFSDVVRRVEEIVRGRPGAIWELYCGAGVAGIAAARTTGRALRGAEVVASAIDAARRSATRIEAEFEVVDLEAPLEGAFSEWPDPAVVIVDPPRRGLSDAVRSALIARGAPVITLSCSPESFARDARAFVEQGWSVDDVWVWEMLPGTPHVELSATLWPPSSHV